MSVYDTHEADPLGRNWYKFLTAGRNSDVSDFYTTAKSGRSTRDCLTLPLQQAAVLRDSVLPYS
jgi:hypothetical protein